MRLTLDTDGKLKVIFGWNMAEFLGQSWATLAGTPINFVISQADQLWIVRVSASPDADEFELDVNGHPLVQMVKTPSHLAYDAPIYRGAIENKFQASIK